MAGKSVLNISIEATTVRYIIQGLRNHPTLRTCIPRLNGANMDTIQKAKTKVTSYFQLQYPKEQTPQKGETDLVSSNSLN